MAVAAKESSGTAYGLEESEVHLLHKQLLRERSERQRGMQLCKAQEEELKRRERQNSSLWEQKIHLERVLVSKKRL